MHSSGLIRWSGQTAILGAALLLISDLLSLTVFSGDPVEIVTTGAYLIDGGTRLLAGVLLLLGLVGLYARQSEASGVLGLVAFLVAFAGTALILGTWWTNAFAAPSLATQAPAFLEAGLTGVLGFVSLAAIPLLFPDGRPPSPRWRSVVWVAAETIVLGTVSFALVLGLLNNYPSVDNPFGVDGARGILQTLLSAGAFVMVVTLLAGIASLVVRYRRSRGTERQQLKWFANGAAMPPLALLGNDLFPSLSWLIGGAGVACVPVAIGIAILKYRPYDIDVSLIGLHAARGSV